MRICIWHTYLQKHSARRIAGRIVRFKCAWRIILMKKRVIQIKCNFWALELLLLLHKLHPFSRFTFKTIQSIKSGYKTGLITWFQILFWYIQVFLWNSNFSGYGLHNEYRKSKWIFPFTGFTPLLKEYYFILDPTISLTSIETLTSWNFLPWTFYIAFMSIERNALQIAHTIAFVKMRLSQHKDRRDGKKIDRFLKTFCFK